MPRSPQVRAALLTLHDYEESDLDKIRAFAENCKYLGFCKEVCPTTDRPHVHVVLQHKRQVAASVLHKLCAPKVIDAKFPLRCTDPTNKHFVCDYLKKGTQSKAEWKLDGSAGQHYGDDAVFEEFGEFVPDGHRSDLDEARRVIQDAPNFRTVLNDTTITDTVAKNMTWARAVFDAKKPKPIENFQPRPWQAALLERLAEPPDDRTIIWVYDPLGAAGKTTLSNYLVRNHGATILAGKAQDMFYAYDMEKIVIVDLPRSTKDEFINYGAIEKLKDGIFFSGKYASALKCRDFNAHVIVFSNHEPEADKWTADRVLMIRLSEHPVQHFPQFD